jgi:osmotically-inducible protein OsmY
MIRTLLRLILIVIVIIGLGAFFIGYRWGGSSRPVSVDDRPVATTGPARDIETARDRGVDTSRAREIGAEVGEKVAVGADRAERAVAAASLTAKIKSKMALDDTVDAARIDVDSSGTVVTLTGTVRSQNEKMRALQLARETEGVTSVVDRLNVEK